MADKKVDPVVGTTAPAQDPKVSKKESDGTHDRPAAGMIREAGDNPVTTFNERFRPPPPPSETEA